ncbi:MAG: serine hydroxymethyltransferase [Anaerolineae bacterium]|nr:serine hydroxymethyltransferase [Anaerolineae bacterium]
MQLTQLKQFDPEVYALICQEEKRQQDKLSLIPSENFSIPAVREALASVFGHKYAEGQIGRRYYEGNQVVDALDALCQERVRTLFALPDDWAVNVQALAGSNANLGVYNGLLEPRDTILSMYLPDGGHLSHGWSYPGSGQKGLQDQVASNVYLGGDKKVSIVSKFFKVLQYKVDPQTRVFDYEQIRKIAREHKPQMIISGGTAYPREIDHAALAGIAKEVSAYYLADISHEAGLVAAGVNASPMGVADVVTFTTHKTLRGPRGAIVAGRAELMSRVDFGIFPGLQGGPFEHTIASVAVCLKDAATEQFRDYGQQVVANARRLAEQLLKQDYDVVTNGTDKHLVLVDLRNKGLSGRNPAIALDIAGIVLNRNSVPNETGSPMNPSGIRMGTPIITTRGMKEAEVDQIAQWIDRVIRLVAPFCQLKSEEFRSKMFELPELTQIAADVQAMCARFPLNI